MSRAAIIELAERAGVEVADVIEYWEERAAIREIDGGQERAAAERDAVDDIRELLAVGRWTFGERKGPRSAEAAPERERDRKPGC